MLGDPHSPLLPYVLRIVGVLWCVTSFTAIWWTVSLARSSSGPPERVTSAIGAFDGHVMFDGLNAGLGLYLIFASANLIRYRQGVDVFLLCQGLSVLAAATLMLLAPAYHGYWAAEILMSSIGVVLVSLIWLPVRAAVAAVSHPGTQRP
ncbi:hypothetical protein CCUG63695_00790 [Mycobacteroides franklinii]|uniref:Uncharacterized protein n=2 Tax=Mycobacteroides franklinii TaxID=948102 RepID=A0A4R8QZP8_9MYCO|nr:hypothetical protein CCUG64054_01425 [Mycobacteroides franklinii]TDZ49265.1 hypothetical protein CCUG63697_03801 [Mycobacteroides franklinii]TDZ59445.1 hypothetical protein CCUG63696_01427 [Mycobacteroides franklinii]TDZ66960.1 hypothetical protein CCUG63695_00790 [Mycobacteroides franklinii]TDZ72884.1 hypothetical protein CCUG64056_01425 [Mycobacteroides franklinii]